MAKEEDQAEPAYIDYSGASTTPNTYTGKDVANAFTGALWRERKVGVSIVSVKDYSLAKKIASEYEPDVIEMICEKWAKTAKIDSLPKFNFFYTQRHQLAESTADKDYEW